MGKELIGILMAASGAKKGELEKEVAELQRMPEEERLKHMIVKELDESYRNKTFREVAEYMIKDKDALELTEQKITADKAKSSLKQHNPPGFICYFNAYSADNTSIRDQNGQLEIGMNEKIAPYITSRQQGCREYDCIDMMCVGFTGLGAKPGKDD